LSFATTASATTDAPELFEPPKVSDLRTKLYGYVDAYAGKSAARPASIDASGNTVREGQPHEFDIPNVIGIEPPEILDSDHLMVTRTTNFMVHGRQLHGPDLLHARRL
jgi:hypothetical protein